MTINKGKTIIALFVSGTLLTAMLIVSHRERSGSWKRAAATGLVSYREAAMAADIGSSAVAADVIRQQVIRTASLDLVVGNVRDTATKIETLVQAVGGHVESSNFSDSAGGTNGGQITIRGPAVRAPEIRAQIKALAVRAQNEKTETVDVTKQVVDSQARLRNYRAEESQYLEILNRAASIKDMIEVAGKLSEVRGEMEQLQGELNYLSHQVEFAAITVNLQTEAESSSFANGWGIRRELRSDWQRMLQGFAEYIRAMIAFALFLPVALFWTCTLAFILALLWRLYRRFKIRLSVPLQ